MYKVIIYFIKKYIFSNRKEWLRSDSVFMVVGIIVSVATLTIAQAIFEGYETVLKETILGANSHIYVFLSSDGYLNKDNLAELDEFLTAQPEVAAISPIIITQVMASGNGKIKGALLRGINWQQENQPTLYREKVFAGTYDLSDENSTVIGSKLAQALNIKVGDKIKLISPMNSKMTPMGVKPKQQEFTVGGLYESGMYDYDSKYVFVNYATAAEFSAMEDEFSMLEVKLKPEFIEKADYLAYRWQVFLDYQYQISSWIDFNGNLFSLLTLEKWVIFIILSFLILIASFNVVSSVSTSIIEKRQELGILKAFGASHQLLQKIFVGKTLIISVIAVSLGQILGVLIAKFLSWQKFFVLKGDVYFLDKINVQFSVLSWLLILGVSLSIVILASFIPLRKISTLEITDILRGKN
ncbi:MAG: ABC transporter permease [Candidatus Cloacimonadales bacterium]|nr:ABC transporter permease [Candidatus Cloacimonadales bacterium]